MNTKVLFATLAVIAIILPVSVFAGSNLDSYKAASNKAIYLDTNWLNSEISVINSRKGLTDSRKTFLINIVNADITIMNGMKADIANETDLRMANKDYKSIKSIFSTMKSGIREASGW